MKTLLALTLFASTAFAGQQEVYKCNVTEVSDSSFFEESLSVEEYPTISLTESNGKYSVTYGANRPFESSEGDSVTVVAKGHVTRVQAITRDWDTIVLDITTVEDSPFSAKVKVKTRESSSLKTIASAICILEN